MKTSFLKPLQPLFVSIAIVAAIATSPIKSLANPPNGEETTPDPVLDREQPTEQQQTGTSSAPIAEESDFFGVARQLLLNASSPVLGLVSLLIALSALGRVKKQREEVLKLMGRYQNLLTRLGGIEVQMEQERLVNQNKTIAISAPTQTSTQTPITPAQPSWPLPQPAAETPSAPEPISKATLINALNTGDRQPLRAASEAELNITSESENSLAMGKAIATELEEVAGGGSYWLIAAEGQNWLFPTDRTLRGFAAVQPSKGLFHYEQQTIAQPKLIEPALLERSGSRWTIKTMGKIGMP